MLWVGWLIKRSWALLHLRVITRGRLSTWGTSEPRRAQLPVGASPQGTGGRSPQACGLWNTALQEPETLALTPKEMLCTVQSCKRPHSQRRDLFDVWNMASGKKN